MAPLCSPLCSTIVLTPVLTTGLRQCAPPLCSPLCSPLAASTCGSAPVAAGVPADLSERILEFFEYKLRSSKSGLQTTGIDELPAELAMLLTIQLHKDIIQKCPIFTNLPAQHLVSLLRKMRPVIFVPGHLVVKEGVVNPNLYFIHRGVVKVWKGYFGAEAQRLHLATLTNNDFFGETSLVQSTAKQQAVPEEEDDEEDADGGPPPSFSAFTPKSTGTLMATLRAELDEESERGERWRRLCRRSRRWRERYQSPCRRRATPPSSPLGPRVAAEAATWASRRFRLPRT